MATTREETSASNADADDDSSTQPAPKASFGTPRQWIMALVFVALGLGRLGLRFGRFPVVAPQRQEGCTSLMPHGGHVSKTAPTLGEILKTQFACF